MYDAKVLAAMELSMSGSQRLAELAHGHVGRFLVCPVLALAELIAHRLVGLALEPNPLLVNWRRSWTVSSSPPHFGHFGSGFPLSQCSRRPPFFSTHAGQTWAC